MRDIVGAAECGDRTGNAISWINCIPFHERQIGSQARQQSSYQFRALHYCCGRAAKATKNGQQIVVRPKACRGGISGSVGGAPVAGNE
jgi:hypothetical protein